MEHTYFMKSMDWQANGTYYDEKNNTYPLSGQVRIIRSQKEWSLDGFMEVAFEAPARFTNAYEIESTDNASTLRWKSFNPALGTLQGTFEIIGRHIISSYVSSDKVYSGTEILIQKDETAYENAGVSFCNGVKMSSWEADILGKPINKKKVEDMTKEELWQLFPILLRDHSSEYAGWYKEESGRLERALGPERIKRISHIGSTFVKGLLAKPTVDILLEVEPGVDVEWLKKILKQENWSFMNESREPDFRLVYSKGYTEEGFAEKVFHLHIRYPGDYGELYFRDYLAAHPEAAREYAALKRDLLKMYEHDRDAYTDAKTEFVEQYTRLAREEFGDRYRWTMPVKKCD